VEHYFTGKNVVPQSVFAPANPPLPFPRLHLRELLDIELSSSIVRVVAEDFQEFFKRGGNL
jgi:hypothetical protein